MGTGRALGPIFGARPAHQAEFVEEVSVMDPDSNAPVEVSIYKHRETGGMLGIDSSYLDQCFDDDENPVIPDPFCKNDGTVELLDRGKEGVH